MELKEFISNALIDITQGISDAQKKSGDSGAIINPHINIAPSELSKHGLIWAGGTPAHLIKFDLAVTVTEGSGTKGGIGILAGAISLGSSGQSNSESMVVSRIQFSIPVIYPSVTS